MNRYQVKIELGLDGLLDDLTGAAIYIGARHGMRADHSALKELRQTLRDVLQRDLAPSDLISHRVVAIEDVKADQSPTS